MKSLISLYEQSFPFKEYLLFALFKVDNYSVHVQG